MTHPSAEPLVPRTPATRFQGSKLKLLDWLWGHLRPLRFHTVLDAFSGSACVSHFFKGRGKSVTCNDLLTSSYLCGLALVENERERLADDEADALTGRRGTVHYDDLIARTFSGIYFTDEENAWLDVVAQNIPTVSCPYRRAIAWYALFQSAMAKRPYNLFHRRNLYMRLAPVARTFGNKATWDKPFDAHFRHFVRQANAAITCGEPCRAVNGDALAVAGEFDLVYIDPPYLNRRGVGVDYHGFYHFLEGLASYGHWEARIDFDSAHRRMKPVPSPWTSRAQIHGAFRELFRRFGESTIAVSYRSDGIPSVEELVDLLREVKRNVVVHRREAPYKYVLSTNAASQEVVLIGTDEAT
ncbi:MAG: putative methylase [Phycisphaerales bacterium]|nr:putative methylase [Phycisphaerales bacterium]MDB5356146.1 putative methylase [Phycisphaerales bacterium]